MNINYSTNNMFYTQIDPNYVSIKRNHNSGNFSTYSQSYNYSSSWNVNCFSTIMTYFLAFKIRHQGRPEKGTYANIHYLILEWNKFPVKSLQEWPNASSCLKNIIELLKHNML